MKQIRLSELSQNYSHELGDKPEMVWALAVRPNRVPGGVHGIPLTIIEMISEKSSGWTGWGFGEQNSWVLFENKDDALMAKLSLGEIYV